MRQRKPRLNGQTASVGIPFGSPGGMDMYTSFLLSYMNPNAISMTGMRGCGVTVIFGDGRTFEVG